MMRITITALLFIAMFFATDELRAIAQHQIHEGFVAGLESHAWLARSQNFVWANVFAYVAIFFVAGAILAWRASTTYESIVLAALLGLAVPGATLLFGPLHPFTYSTHAPAWLEVLFWANWYLPPMACVLGALALRRVAPLSSRVTNAA